MLDQLAADMSEVWSPAEIEHLSLTACQALGLGNETARVLSEAGVPKSVEYMFELRPLAPRANGDWIGFGSDGGCDLAVRAPSGEVRAIAGSPEVMSRFVNSSLPQFLQFLARVTGERRITVDLPEDEALARLEDLIDFLRQADPPALSDRDHWWPVLFEQMADGLL